MADKLSDEQLEKALRALYKFHGDSLNLPGEWYIALRQLRDRCRELMAERDLLVQQEQDAIAAIKKRDAQLAAVEKERDEFVQLLDTILDHDVANRGTESVFFTCYTYPTGKLPDWVAKAESLIAATREPGTR